MNNVFKDYAKKLVAVEISNATQDSEFQSLAQANDVKCFAADGKTYPVAYSFTAISETRVLLLPDKVDLVKSLDRDIVDFPAFVADMKNA